MVSNISDPDGLPIVDIALKLFNNSAEDEIDNMNIGVPVADIKILLASLANTLDPVPDETTEFEAEALLGGSEVLAPLTTTLDPVPDETIEFEAEALLDGSEILLPDNIKSGVLVDTDKPLLIADEILFIENVNKLNKGFIVTLTIISPGVSIIVKPIPIGITNLLNPVNNSPTG